MLELHTLRREDHRREYQHRDRDDGTETHAAGRDDAIDADVAFVPLVFDRAGRVKEIEIRRDCRAEHRDGHKPVMNRVVMRQRDQRATRDLCPRRMYHDRADDEAQRDQSEYRNALLDNAEGALPDYEPHDERNGYGPPLKMKARRWFGRGPNAADLRRQNQQAD